MRLAPVARVCLLPRVCLCLDLLHSASLSLLFCKALCAPPLLHCCPLTSFPPPRSSLVKRQAAKAHRPHLHLGAFENKSTMETPGMSLPQYKCAARTRRLHHAPRLSSRWLPFSSFTPCPCPPPPFPSPPPFPFLRTGASGVVSIRVYKGKALTAPGVEYKSVLAHPGSKARKVHVAHRRQRATPRRRAAGVPHPTFAPLTRSFSAP